MNIVEVEWFAEYRKKKSRLQRYLGHIVFEEYKRQYENKIADPYSSFMYCTLSKDIASLSSWCDVLTKDLFPDELGHLDNSELANQNIEYAKQVSDKELESLRPEDFQSISNELQSMIITDKMQDEHPIRCDILNMKFVELSWNFDLLYRHGQC